MSTAFEEYESAHRLVLSIHNMIYIYIDMAVTVMYGNANYML